MRDDDGWNGHDDVGSFEFARRSNHHLRFCCRHRYSGQMGVEPESTREEDALEVLKKRYAKGEISKDEYERIKADIR